MIAIRCRRDDTLRRVNGLSESRPTQDSSSRSVADEMDSLLSDDTNFEAVTSTEQSETEEANLSARSQPSQPVSPSDVACASRESFVSLFDSFSRAWYGGGSAQPISYPQSFLGGSTGFVMHGDLPPKTRRSCDRRAGTVIAGLIRRNSARSGKQVGRQVGQMMPTAISPVLPSGRVGRRAATADRACGETASRGTREMLRKFAVKSMRKQHVGIADITNRSADAGSLRER